MKKTHKKTRRTQRISWTEQYLMMAIIASKRSHDSQTKVGCILVDENNTILSSGYNGLCRDLRDSIMPTTRPDKYTFMMHSEINAILNCARQGKSTLNATAYITGHPCIQCYQFMKQAGIKNIIWTNYSQIKSDNRIYKKKEFALLRRAEKKRLIITEYPFSLLKNIINSLS